MNPILIYKYIYFCIVSSWRPFRCLVVLPSHPLLFLAIVDRVHLAILWHSTWEVLDAMVGRDVLSARDWLKEVQNPHV
jgi:hypothetical protein